MYRILKNNKFSICLLLYLIILAFYPANAKFNFIVILSVLSITFVIVRFLAYLPAVPFYMCLTFVAFIITTESVYAFAYNNQVGYSEIEVIYLTNYKEAKGMFSMLLFTIIASTIISFGLVFLSGREIKKNNYSIKYSFFFIVFFILANVSYLTYKLSEDKDFHTRDISDSSSFFIYYYLRTTSPTFYSPIYSTLLYFKDVSRFEKLRSAKREDVKGIYHNGQGNENDSIKRTFVILGESLTRRNMSLYGYNKQVTTPFLDSLYQINQLQKYNALSTANFTNRAIPFIITHSNVDSWYEHFNHKTAIDLAQDVNRKTHWLSNQPKTDMFNTQAYGSEPVNLGITADYSYFAPSEVYLEDLDLLDHYTTQNEHSINDTQLVFFHLRGSHQPYKEGYDKIDVEQLPSIQGLKEDEIDYNRTVYHTDRLLRKLYNTINPDKDVIIFVSDHGEEVGVGHFTQNLLKSQYEVPFVVISNNDNYMEFLNQCLTDDNYISTDSVFYLIAYLMGYNVDEMHTKMVKEQTKKVLNASLIYNYDTDLK